MKKAIVYILVAAFVLSLIPAVALGAPGFNVYTSGITEPNRIPSAQFQPVDRSGDGGEFLISLVDNGNGFPAELYVASNRAAYDYFFYKTQSGDWLQVSGGVSNYHAINVQTMSYELQGISSLRELRIKIVSTSQGTSQVAFGIDAVCAVDMANNRTLTHDFSHIFGERSYAVTFSAPTGAGSGSNINANSCFVVGPTSVVPARPQPFNNYDAGAEYTVTLIGNSAITANDKVFIATSRPNLDYLYYRVGNGAWQPYHGGGMVPMANALALTAFTHTSQINNTTHELKVKIVSATPGTTQVVFGTDAASVSNFASGSSLTASTGLNSIIRQQRYPVEFVPPGTIDTSVSANINTTYTVVSGPSYSTPAQTLPLVKSDIGADFVLTVVGNGALTPTDRLYIASSRPNTDYLYYRIGSGDWLPYHSGGDIPMGGTLTLTPFTHSASTSSNIHEMRLKVISTVPGTSQIAFGVDAACVTDYTRDRNLTHDINHILGQRKYSVQFTSAYYNKNVGHKINVQGSFAVGPNRMIAAQTLPLNRYSDGAEFNVTLSGLSALTANDKLYVASSRPDSDYLFYRTSAGDWAPYYSSGDIPMASALPLIPFTHSTSTSATIHELRLKIVSTAGGTSQIVFGSDPIDVADFAAGGNMSQNFGLSNIIGQRSYPAEFSGAVGSNQITLSVNGYYNYGYGSPQSGAYGEKNMSNVSDQISANNSSAYTLTVTVLNPGGNPAANREVIFSIASGTGASLSATRLNTNNSGKAEVMVRSSVAGTVDVIATVNGIAEQGGSGRKDRVSLVFKSSSGDSQITGFRGESIDCGIKLSWDPLSSGMGYRLYRSDNPNYDGSALVSHIITSSEFVDVNVSANTTYYYALRQVISAGNQSTGAAEQLGGVSTKVAVTTKSTILGANLGSSWGGGSKKFIMMSIDSPFMSANGARKEVDTGRGTSPIIINSRTMVPIRAIVEEMGGTADWIDATREISLRVGANSVLMWLDKTNITANGVSKTMDVAPVSVNGRTMVPIRFATENLGCVVEWVPATSQIVIVYY